MIHLRRITAKVGLIVSLVFLLSLAKETKAQDGKALFTANCASCHNVHKDMTGPALAGVEDRWPDRAAIIAWVDNSSKVIASGDKYANTLYEAWNKTAMTHFAGILSNDDVNAILDYIKVEEANKPAAAPAGATADQGEKSGSDNTILYVVLTGVLAIVAFILLQVNSSLKRMSNKKEGQPVIAPIPFYRNKKFIAVVSILIFVYIGFWLSSGAIGLGRTQNYEPKQPIFYSHKVHAGINQINCLYCHTNAQYSRHATIPSVNVCMNCHMAITEYTGPKLFTAEGEEVDGSAEIQKLYDYAGYVKGQPWDESKAKPIEWVRIHELPDHVYFNHSQHVMVGKVQCQTCHGDITKMDEVKQFAPLSMGWCINCHRTTDVQFKDNGFYSIYQKYHEGLKNGTIDSAKGITVEMVGGIDCQKCHY